ncbi:YuiA family protein [Salinithrix halophila]|uniref:YuiA family protein n=1 Tax=Salinithrix halophila TaxID=1485204 RepID=A0ABV8JJ83_9BACL
MTTNTLIRTEEKCLYCGGQGYYQLLLGGSETCGCCEGTGKKPKK